jgi:hypothetical protein
VFASVDADVKVWVYRVYTPRVCHFKTEEEPVDVGISDIGIAMDSLFSDKPMVPMMARLFVLLSGGFVLPSQDGYS